LNRIGSGCRHSGTGGNFIFSGCITVQPLFYWACALHHNKNNALLADEI